jgi:hypothetical protein
MTAKHYVGSDFELRELIDEQGRADTATALEEMLTSDGLAGRLGERIMARGITFRGRAGARVRKDYIKFVMEETDLRVHACDYGWCVFQPETARCQGQLAPNDASRSPAVCLSCANMVVDERHVPFWRDRRSRNAALLPAASLLTRTVLLEAIEQCDSVLIKVGAKDGEEETRLIEDSGQRDRQSVPGSTSAPGTRRRPASKAHCTDRSNHTGRGGKRGGKKPQPLVYDPPKRAR